VALFFLITAIFYILSFLKTLLPPILIFLSLPGVLVLKNGFIFDCLSLLV